jgi:tRNA1Val (adenine37-N6)-methyltransferase
MGNSFFQFKQFKIDQGKCAMKVSTDAVILGAFSGSKVPHTVLDIGTGTGVIALMLAQRNPGATITALELDPEAFAQASENIHKSPWPSRTNVVGLSLQAYQNCGNEFDLIVSNPPYFPNHLLSEDGRRNQAMHQNTLTFDDLIAGVEKLLKGDGEFWIILPERQMDEFEKLANMKAFVVFHTIVIKDSPGKPVLRVVQGFSREPRISSRCVSEELIIKTETGGFSVEYRQLLKEFMLHF